MVPDFLAQAKGCLKLCERAYGELQNALTDESEFQTHWGDFLVQWKRTYMRIQHAAKSTPQELQWFGAGVNKERRDDALLRWLYEARNDGEHFGLPSAKHRPHLSHMRATQDISQLRVRFHPDGSAEAVGEDGELLAERIAFEPGVSELQPVMERDKKKWVPAPTSHMGQAIEPIPMVAADLGLRWMQALVATAEAMN